MPQFSLLVRVQDPNPVYLRKLVESFQQQTVADAELILVVDNAADQGTTLDCLQGAAARIELCPAGALLAWHCNTLLPTLGTWVGFVDQHDLLAPTALEAIQQGILTTPLARVIYTDEEMHSDFGTVSMRFNKGVINPMRLRSQEYLRSLAVMQVSFLVASGGFDRLASDCPTHDYYLRVLESQGPGAFLNIPERLYWRRRSYPPAPLAKPQQASYMVDYDLHAVQQHLVRSALPAKARQIHGTLEVSYQFDRQPSVGVIMTVGDDLLTGLAAIKSLNLAPVYRPRNVKIIYAGNDLAIAQEYMGRCSGLRFSFRHVVGSLVAALNQEGLTADVDYLLFVHGRPLNPYWMHKLVDYMQQPGIGAVGARLMSPNRLSQPGVSGYQYEGWHWNSRGRFNVLTVPHQISMLSPACLLLDCRQFHSSGGFAPNLPTLYGMDYCLHLDQAGLANILVPDSLIEVEETPIDPAELVQLQQSWGGWKDRFNLHQSL
jgi:hypothetical protein